MRFVQASSLESIDDYRLLEGSARGRKQTAVWRRACRIGQGVAGDEAVQAGMRTGRWV
jgi:hypothetical protein